MVGMHTEKKTHFSFECCPQKTVGSLVTGAQDAHSEHRLPAPSSLKEGCRKPVLGVEGRMS